jgi:N-acetylglucosaminyl-diphospho-decaprenol L-rhamnosyltransferase
MVAVIVVNYRTPELAACCIRSLAAERRFLPGLEVILVDNASGDGSPEIMREALYDLIEEGFVTILPLALNGGFGWGNNQALLRLTARAAPPEFVMLLNPDCQIEPGAIHCLVNEMHTHLRSGVAGSQLVNPDGSLSGSAFFNHSVANEFVRGTRATAIGRLLGVTPVLATPTEATDVDWVAGAACLFRVEALAEAGLFDEGFFLYYEEVELMSRIRRAGWSVVHVPGSRVMHIGGAATGLREGQPIIEKAMPLYWYKSRRRYFTRVYGAFSAWAASLAWLMGDRVAALIGLLIPGRRKNTSADRNQLYICGIRPRLEDSRACIIRIGDPINQPPAWMSFVE